MSSRTATESKSSGSSKKRVSSSAKQGSKKRKTTEQAEDSIQASSENDEKELIKQDNAGPQDRNSVASSADISESESKQKHNRKKRKVGNEVLRCGLGPIIDWRWMGRGTVVTARKSTGPPAPRRPAGGFTFGSNADNSQEKV